MGIHQLNKAHRKSTNHNTDNITQISQPKLCMYSVEIRHDNQKVGPLFTIQLNHLCIDLSSQTQVQVLYYPAHKFNYRNL